MTRGPETRDHRIAVCVFAKPPTPGAVKTRLAEVVGPAAAARLAEAFVRDTWDAVSQLPWARPVLATTGPGIELGAEADAVWLQGGGDLGARLERVMSRALESHVAAIAVGADSPATIAARLPQARMLLAQTDAVLGPTEDGGFDLIGLRECPPAIFRGLPWSHATTCRRTASRLREGGLGVGLLSTGFDVDRPADLHRLRRMLGEDPTLAPATAAVLADVPVAGAARRVG
ncbi:MAG: TIGR04282 family arsenosugar biosynthesis glycosyltransferase [Myxococcota bacterium]